VRLHDISGSLGITERSATTIHHGIDLGVAAAGGQEA
jgi:hypothetical protein